MLMILLLSSVVVFAADPPELEKKREVYAAWARARARQDPDPIGDAAKATRQSRNFVEQVVAEYRRNGGRSDEEAAPSKKKKRPPPSLPSSLSPPAQSSRSPSVVFSREATLEQDYSKLERRKRTTVTFYLRNSAIGGWMKLSWWDDYATGRRSFVQLDFQAAGQKARYDKRCTIEALTDGKPLGVSNRPGAPRGLLTQYKFKLTTDLVVVEDVWAYLEDDEVERLLRTEGVVELRVNRIELKMTGNDLKEFKRALARHSDPIEAEPKN